MTEIPLELAVTISELTAKIEALEMQQIDSNVTDSAEIGDFFGDFTGNSGEQALGGGNFWLDQFVIYDVTATTFKITANRQETTGGVWFKGAKKTIATGTGMTFSTDHWLSTIGASTYVYLHFERSTTAVTIMAGTTIYDGDGQVSNRPLWYIPFADGAITTASIVDMRSHQSIEAMA